MDKFANYEIIMDSGAIYYPPTVDKRVLVKFIGVMRL